jgi:pyruvate/2-oxoglutarate dehydrogenase complex dihydrolipoamide acyltransferase (E2) component
MSNVQSVTVPHETVNDQAVTLVAWLVADGAPVELGQPVAEVEGSKTTFQIVAPVAGVLRHTRSPGAEIDVGGELGIVSEAADVPQPAANGNGTAVPAPHHESERPSPTPIASSVSPAKVESAGARFSKPAATLMLEHGLAPEAFAGRGMVSARDVRDYLGESPSRPKPATPSTSTEQPVAAKGVPFRTEHLSRAKRTEAKYLRAGVHSALQSVVSVAVPTRGLREAATRSPELQGNVTALIIFEAARLLRQFPYFNAVHQDGDAILYDEVHIGLAIDAGCGLKVPVLHNADRKTIIVLANEMRELVVHYLNDTLPVASLRGGTFTVTDLSAEEVVNFLPLLNQGQSAILGVGAEAFPKGSREGSFNLTLAFDHQLSEGRQAARFLRQLRDRLQHYESAMRPTIRIESADDEPQCSECLRPVSELRNLRAHLIQTVGTAHAPALVCSICLAGF